MFIFYNIYQLIETLEKYLDLYDIKTLKGKFKGIKIEFQDNLSHELFDKLKNINSNEELRKLLDEIKKKLT